jgi:hypothetical protein
MNTHLECEISLRNKFLFPEGVYLNDIAEYIDIIFQMLLYLHYTHVTGKGCFIYNRMQIE